MTVGQIYSVSGGAGVSQQGRAVPAACSSRTRARRRLTRVPVAVCLMHCVEHHAHPHPSGTTRVAPPPLCTSRGNWTEVNGEAGTTTDTMKEEMRGWLPEPAVGKQQSGLEGSDAETIRGPAHAPAQEGPSLSVSATASGASPLGSRRGRTSDRGSTDFSVVLVVADGRTERRGRQGSREAGLSTSWASPLWAQGSEDSPSRDADGLTEDERLSRPRFLHWIIVRRSQCARTQSVEN